MIGKRSFDADLAIDQAVQVFWEKGYGETSMRDLVKATGLCRYRMYSAFGSKHGLFVRALERYQKLFTADAVSVLEQEDASLPQLQEYLEALKEMTETEQGQMGCFICNTATELAKKDPDLATMVQSFYQKTQGLLETLMENAKRKGELRSDLDPKSTAAMVNTLVQGLAVMVRAGAGVDELSPIGQALFTVLTPCPHDAR